MRFAISTSPSRREERGLPHLRAGTGGPGRAPTTSLVGLFSAAARPRSVTSATSPAPVVGLGSSRRDVELVRADLGQRAPAGRDDGLRERTSCVAGVVLTVRLLTYGVSPSAARAQSARAIRRPARSPRASAARSSSRRRPRRRRGGGPGCAAMQSASSRSRSSSPRSSEQAPRDAVAELARQRLRRSVGRVAGGLGQEPLGRGAPCGMLELGDDLGLRARARRRRVRRHQLDDELLAPPARGAATRRRRGGAAAEAPGALGAQQLLRHAERLRRASRASTLNS